MLIRLASALRFSAFFTLTDGGRTENACFASALRFWFSLFSFSLYSLEATPGLPDSRPRTNPQIGMYDTSYNNTTCAPRPPSARPELKNGIC